MSGIEDGPVGWSTPEQLDAREVFFIRHAENIHRWAAIEKDVQASALRFLTSLAEDIEQRGSIPGIDEAGVTLDIRKDEDNAALIRHPRVSAEEIKFLGISLTTIDQ